MDTALRVLAIVAVLGLVFALFVWGAIGFERQCAERGGWFTFVGGQPTCLPPGGK